METWKKKKKWKKNKEMKQPIEKQNVHKLHYIRKPNNSTRLEIIFTPKNWLKQKIKMYNRNFPPFLHMTQSLRCSYSNTLSIIRRKH